MAIPGPLSRLIPRNLGLAPFMATIAVALAACSNRGTTLPPDRNASAEAGNGTQKTKSAAATTAQLISVAASQAGWNKIELRTTAGARCVMPGSTSADDLITYADPDGIIDLYIRALPDAVSSLNTQITCASGSTSTTFPLTYHLTSQTLPGLIVPPSQPATQPIATEAQIEAAIARLGFDPRTAPAQELREHDLPLPPNAPANSSAYQSWLYTTVSPITNVVHTGVLTDLYNGRGEQTGVETKLSGSSVSPDCAGCGNYSLNSPNWSGYQGDGGQGTVGLISGQWNMPSAAAQMPSGTYYDAMWVGIDGGYSHYPFPNSSDVFQTGTETKVTSNGGLPDWRLLYLV